MKYLKPESIKVGVTYRSRVCDNTRTVIKIKGNEVWFTERGREGHIMLKNFAKWCAGEAELCPHCGNPL